VLRCQLLELDVTERRHKVDTDHRPVGPDRPGAPARLHRVVQPVIEELAEVHGDDREQAYLKVMMDEVLGRENFVTTIVWQNRFSRSNDATISISHDYIVVCSRDACQLG
jgi:hypothetical protein